LSKHPAHRVRIIGGMHRGRFVRVPDASDVRPTPDRVRETLFNWLGQDLSGLRTLELYAGTGVLSLESLSRGAAHAVAVDRSRATAQSLRAAAAMLEMPMLEIHVADAKAYLDRESRTFDVVYLDPPFAEDPWTWLLPACAARIDARGYIYAEADHALTPPPSLSVHRHARAGQVHYHLLIRSEDA
jgi:16S rRNA (guanine966-N2)-methyltransferase